jgi:hypothetical protein
MYQKRRLFHVYMIHFLNLIAIAIIFFSTAYLSIIKLFDVHQNERRRPLTNDAQPIATNHNILFSEWSETDRDVVGEYAERLVDEFPNLEYCFLRRLKGRSNDDEKLAAIKEERRWERREWDLWCDWEREEEMWEFVTTSEGTGKRKRCSFS